MIQFVETDFSSVDDSALEAATRSGLVTRDLRGLDELQEAVRLVRSVNGGSLLAPVDLLQTLSQSGNYVGGAWRGASLVGAAFGFLGNERGAVYLRSHLISVGRGDQGAGVGLALKLHQRAWALSRGIHEITWTYDPLARRNAWFNLAKLRARATAYYPNFHGPMTDEVNNGDESDRCLVRWDLDQPFSLGQPHRNPPADTSVALISSAAHTPIVHDRPMDGRRIMCQIPEDVVAWRRRDPGLARDWRVALRHTMGSAIAAGYSATSMTRDGWYLLERAAL
ncbi:MAG TPA: hypothetical protein VG435_10655 [Acidimicrobiales bacterium]|jgi:predicted GNAT superfamily acetyltransferase|nr:hypothetical protein [Acidimicrobiales bacterium]